MANPSSNPLPSTRHLLTSLISTIASSTKQQNQSEGTSNPLSNTPATSQNTKSAFLTLHSLFPHDFLPALDLLDRGLVTRFVLAREPEVEEPPEENFAGGENDDTGDPENERQRTETLRDDNQTEQRPHSEPQANHAKSKRKRKETTVYQVRSAQRTKTSSRSDHPTSTTTTTGTSYEVRLEAWNCSCPAFAFAALPVDAAENGHRDDGIGGDGDDAGYGLTGHQSDTTATAVAHDGEDEIAWLGFGGLTRGKDVPVCKHLLACVVAERCQGFEQLVEEKEVGVEEVAGWAAGWGD
jgi:hypothetical protein